MDDFNLASLQESKNEWCVRLLNVLQPQINEGIRSIFKSARTLCIDNREPDKYLLTFQNLLTRVPLWNSEIISTETNRIIQSSNCKYLEDLITCVHIIQLKLLTYARVGTKYKKLDISIPKLNDFIHKIYINCARVFYQHAFLFRMDISTVDIQKNNVNISQHIKECIMNSVRDSIPFELMVRSYLDETHETFDEIKEDITKPSTSFGGESIKDIDISKPEISSVEIEKPTDISYPFNIEHIDKQQIKSDDADTSNVPILSLQNKVDSLVFETEISKNTKDDNDISKISTSSSLELINSKPLEQIENNTVTVEDVPSESEFEPAENTLIECIEL